MKKKLEKTPVWQLTKDRNKNEMIAEARNKGKTVHFTSLMDVCHLKNSELESQFQKYKGQIVIWGDIVFRIFFQYLLSKDHRRHKWRLQK